MSGWGLVLVFLFFAALRPAMSYASIGLIDRQGESIPAADLRFTDENGRAVTLAEYFHADRPVLLTPVYFRCPGVCTVTLNNLVQTLKYVNPSPGKGFEVIAVSIDSQEGSDLARAKKENYLKAYGRPETADGWHFLTGDETNIAKLAATVGFQFERDAIDKKINHPSALFVLSPVGKITATYSGYSLTHRELRVALFEAQEGKVEAFLNRINAFCYGTMPHPGLINSPGRWLSIIAALVAAVFVLFAVRGTRFQ